MSETQSRLAQLLLARLERISADSYLAHRASGVRGALLRALDASTAAGPPRRAELVELMDLGFRILQRAAEERVR